MHLFRLKAEFLVVSVEVSSSFSSQKKILCAD